MFTEEKMTVNNNRDLKGNSLIECIDNYTVIDIETTGLDPKINKIIELAALKVQDNQVIDTFSCLINPEVEIDNFITKLTGISQDMVKDAPVLDDVLQKFLDFIGEDVIIGHNVNFDINFIYDNSMLLLNKAVENNYIDTLRISRLNNNVENHKLQTMANYYNIDYTNAHRALKDCYITKELYSCLKNEISKTNEQRNKIVDNFVIPKENPFFNKKIVIKGVIKNYGYEFIEKIALKCKASRVGNIFYNNTDILILSNGMYKKYSTLPNNQVGAVILKARELVKDGKLTVLSEQDFLKLNNIKVLLSISAKEQTNISAKDILATTNEINKNNFFYGKECVFTGTFEKLSRKECMQIIANLGGKNRDTVTRDTKYLILGNNDYNPILRGKKSNKLIKAENAKLNGQDIDIISENVFYDLIEEFLD